MQTNNQDISCIIEPHESRGGLYQGSILSASNLNLLNQYQIKAVLSCCVEATLLYGPEITFLQLDCHDFPNYDMIPLFSKAHQYLDQNRQNTNVLVNCHLGKSRSSCIVLSYLMKKRNMNLQTALGYLKIQRPMIQPNPGFIKQLLLYEIELYGEISSVLTPQLTPYYQMQQTLQEQNYAESQDIQPMRSYQSPVKQPVTQNLHYSTPIIQPQQSFFTVPLIYSDKKIQSQHEIQPQYQYQLPKPSAQPIPLQLPLSQPQPQQQQQPYLPQQPKPLAPPSPSPLPQTIQQQQQQQQQFKPTFPVPVSKEIMPAIRRSV